MERLIIQSLRELGTVNVATSVQVWFLRKEFVEKRILVRRLAVLRRKAEIREIEQNKKFLIKLMTKENEETRGLLVFLDHEDLVINRISDRFTLVLAILIGNREKREVLSKALSRLGMRRGWIKQRFMRSIDDIVKREGLSFELLSLVYELRKYKETFFKAAGTANFWPKGVSSIKDALEEYLYPMAKATGYYVFLKSLQFKATNRGKLVGRYIVDRRGKLVLAQGSDEVFAAKIYNAIFNDIITNFVEHMIEYKVSVIRKAAVSMYSLEKATSIFLEAIEPGSMFFEAAKSLLGKPMIWESKLLILPIEIGNPRLVSRVIDKRTGYAVTTIATYNGLRILPAPGSPVVDSELIDIVLSLFHGLIKEK